MNSAQKVLVIGDDTRSFLATVRSLGRNGLEVHAAPFDFNAPALKSRYISATHWLPYYIGNGQDWLNAFSLLIAQQKFSLVIPCDERAIIPLVLHREQLKDEVLLAIPDSGCLEAFFNKAQTREIASRLGIPISPGRIITPNDTATDLINEAGTPIAIKPTSSYSPESLYTRNKVIIAENRGDLETALEATRSNPHLFEAFFCGTGIGVSVLAHRGQVLQAFQHRRVHEIQGASHYRVSEKTSPPMLKAVESLMQATGYTGIAMVEFRLNDKTGEWILLEVNARPWGSLPLSVALGLDFPYWWHNLLVSGVEMTRRSYPAGIYGRNLLPDIRYLLSSAKAMRGNPGRIALFALKSLAEYCRIFTGREVQDVLQFKDPLPGITEILRAIGDKARAVQRFGVISSLLRRVERRRLRNAVRSDKRQHSIIFLCQGNVCRSPFASALLKRSVQTDPKISISSYGNLPRSEVSSPLNAIKAASDLGIDLSGHKSKALSRGAAERASVIVVFDETNKRWFRERFPTLKTPVVLLGSFLPKLSADRTISDPDGRDLTYFKATYKTIADGIDELSRELSPKITLSKAPRKFTFSLEPVPELEVLESMWKRMDQTGNHSFFLTWAWIGTWLRYQPSLSRVMLLRALDSEQTIGLALITFRQSTIRGLFPIKQAILNASGEPALDCITIEHNGFATRLSEDELWLALVDWFESGSSTVDELVLSGIRTNISISGKQNSIMLERREAGFRTPLGAIRSFEDVATILSRNGRQQLRRSIRKYQRQGPLRIDEAGDTDSALSFFEQMKILHVRSWTRRAQRHAFSNSFFEIFHRALIKDNWAAGGIDLLRISAGPKVLGYLYNFRRNGIVFSYQSGFDDSEPKSRPGYICHALAIAHYGKNGMSYYDFLAETNRLKQSFGIEKYELRWQRLRKLTVGFRMEAYARRFFGRD